MAASKQEIYLVRHGETEWSLSGQHTGVSDIPLTENGRTAARGLRPILADEPFPLVLTSPLGRARETASGLARSSSPTCKSGTTENTKGSRRADPRPEAGCWSPAGSGFRSAPGHHFLLDTAALSILGYYHESLAVKIWNAPPSRDEGRRT